VMGETVGRKITASPEIGVILRAGWKLKMQRRR
jgi:hypothetical protein